MALFRESPSSKFIKESISLKGTAMNSAHSACARRWYIRRECICFYLAAAWMHRPTVDAAFHNERGASVCEFAKCILPPDVSQNKFSVLHFSDGFLRRTLRRTIRDVLNLFGLSRDAIRTSHDSLCDIIYFTSVRGRCL